MDLTVFTDVAARILVGIVVLTALASIVVALRFISRGYILHVLGPTDWFMAVTLLFALVNTVCIIFLVLNQTRQPFAELTVDQQRQFLKINYVGNIFNHASLTLTKVSVLLLFLDVFVITRIRKATYAVMAALVFYGVWLTASNIAICIPIHLYWDPDSHPNNRCIYPSTKFFIDITLNAVFDFVMLILPLPAIWSITLPRRQKLWLYFVAGIGLVVCLMAVLRFISLRDSLTRSDSSAVAINIIFLSTIELNLSIVVACVPTLRPLAEKLWPKLVATTRGSDANEHPPTISSLPQRLRSSESIPLQFSPSAT